MSGLGVKANFVVDEDGKRIGVLLSLSDYEYLEERLSELEAYQAANDIEIVDTLLNQKDLGTFENLGTYRQRHRPGGMIVI